MQGTHVYSEGLKTDEASKTQLHWTSKAPKPPKLPCFNADKTGKLCRANSVHRASPGAPAYAFMLPPGPEYCGFMDAGGERIGQSMHYDFIPSYRLDPEDFFYNALDKFYILWHDYDNANDDEIKNCSKC